MKSCPENLSVARFIDRYYDARKQGLTRTEAEELLADKQAWEKATINREDEDE